MMNDQQENSKRVVKLLRDKPWLVTNNPYVSVELYMRHFEYGRESEFHIFPSMLPYKIEIFDKYRKQVYNTMFWPTGPSSLGMHTVVQPNRDCHIIFMWGNAPDGHATVTYPTIHTTNPQDYLDFLKENESLVYEYDTHSGFTVGGADGPPGFGGFGN